MGLVMMKALMKGPIIARCQLLQYSTCNTPTDCSGTGSCSRTRTAPVVENPNPPTQISKSGGSTGREKFGTII